MEKSLTFKAINLKEEEAMKGFHFVSECKRQELQDDAGMYIFSSFFVNFFGAYFDDFSNLIIISVPHLQDKNDWARSLKFKLLLKWARLVCAHYSLEVENLSTSFSDGRALCHLVHHYYPGFMPR